MKKIRMFSLLIAFVLIVSTLCACQNDQNANQNNQSESSSSQVTSEAPATVSTIRIWTSSASDKKEWTSQIDLFNSGIGAEKGVKIDYQIFGDNYQTSVDTAVSAGLQPEIWMATTKQSQYVAQDIICSLDELPNMTDLLDANKASQIKNLTVFNDKVYSLPLYFTSYSLIYNVDILKNAGFTEPPKTWAEYVDIAKAVTKDNVYGTAIPCKFTSYQDRYIIDGALPGIGHLQYSYSEGKFKFSEFLPYFEDVILPLVEDGSLFPGCATLDNDTLRAQFANGNIAMYIGGSYDVGVLYNQFPAKDNWAVAPIPYMDEDHHYNQLKEPAQMYFTSKNVLKDEAMAAAASEVWHFMFSSSLNELMFTNGQRFPMNDETFKNAAAPTQAQWNTFYELSKTQVMRNPMPDSVITVEGNNYGTVFSQIIAGQVDPATALADLDARYQAAFDKACADGTITKEDWIDPNYESNFVIK